MALAGEDITGLFRAHRRELQAYIRKKVRDAETAADLTQQAFLRFAEQRQANPEVPITHERSYLYRTAHNLAVDHIRRQQRERTSLVPTEELVNIPDETPEPERIVAGHHAVDRVRHALVELPKRTRQVFALVKIEGLTYRQTAERLQISDSSVQKHLAKAIKHVIDRLR